MRYIVSSLIFFVLVNTAISAYCQVERGGVPRSFQFQIYQKSQSQAVEIDAPDILAIQQEDSEDARLEKSYRVGIEIPVKVSPANAGQWDYLPGGGRIWRVTLICKGAKAIGLNYNEIRLPEGTDIFVYTPDHKNVIGALTSTEIPQDQKFATRPLSGEAIVLEYYEPAQVKEQPVIDISGLVYMYRGFETQDSENTKSVTTGSCEVNVNCKEGDNWQRQKRGVVKILTKVGAKYYSCTGTLMNTTSQNFKGLLLTAAHCSKDYIGGSASDSDYAQWVFYFNYEYTGCIPSGTTISTIVGATKLAISEKPSDIGSDFLLIKILKNIPAQYKAYFCGWDAGSGNSTSGVCIHHPAEDVKKISTYTSSLGTGTWGSTPNTHWLVRFSGTTNGWGVTEGGSSGAPLFDDEGLVIGTLTGGQSGCDNTNGEDSFGKVSYSWTSNGTTADMQLKPWLDSLNTGITKMPGSFNDNLTVADFTANFRKIPVGGAIDFQDFSAGKPTKWHWYFQGGRPSESTEENPSGILFERFGKMNVKLVVSNSYNSDSIVKEGFIDVRAIVSPNPCYGEVNILTNNDIESDITIEVFDYLGKMVQRFEYSGTPSANYNLALPVKGNVFIIRVLHGNQVQTHKVIVVRK